MKQNDFSILSENELGQLREFGNVVTASDLAVLMGVDLSTDGGPTCKHWLRDFGDSVNTAKLCSFNGHIMTNPADDGQIGTRPVIYNFVGKAKNKTVRPNGLTVCTYGEYPQSIESGSDLTNLEIMYKVGLVPTTGKTYTLSDGVTYPEYMWRGHRYISFTCPSQLSSVKFTSLSNGEKAVPGKTYWIKIEPIKWFEVNGNLISVECLFRAGIQNQNNYDGNFDKTALKDFLVNYFAKDIDVNNNNSNSNNNAKANKGSKTTSNSNNVNNITLDENMFNENTTKNKNKNETEVKPKTPQERQLKYGISVHEEPMSVKEQINFHIQTGQSFMLHGPSGVGKTGRVKEIDPDLTSITLCNGILPEEVIGKTIYPNGISGGGIWVAPKWYIELCKKCEAQPDKQHVLFIDEITNARETTQSLVYHIALEKSIGPGVGKLPDNTVIVFAGNSKEDSGAAYNMPAPLFRRLSHIFLDLNIQDWLEWGSEHNKKHPENPNRTNIHPLVASFVATYGEKVFYSSYDEEEPQDFALDPRKWERVSDKIYANHGVIRREILESDIGHDLAVSFLAYAKNPPLSLEEVLTHDFSTKDIPQSRDARLAMALSLRNATEEQIADVRRFIKTYLSKEILSVFDSVWIGDDDMRAVQIANIDKKMNNINYYNERG